MLDVEATARDERVRHVDTGTAQRSAHALPPLAHVGGQVGVADEPELPTVVLEQMP